MFGKVFASLWTGSLVGKADEQLVMCYLIANCDPDGCCDHHPEVIASLTGLGLDRTRAALDALSAPDPESRISDHEGRRIALLEGRKWGWTVLNYLRYRNQGPARASLSTSGHVYYAGIPGGTIVKIGFSKNPWARLADLRVTEPRLKLLAIEHGTMEMEHDLHQQFADLRVGGEWFKNVGPLAQRVRSVAAAGSAERSAGVATPVATKEVDVEVDASKSTTLVTASAATVSRADERRDWDEALSLLWPDFPRKVGKPAALRAWRGIRPQTQETFDAIEAGLVRWVAYWHGKDRDKVCHPATWLNQRRWEDEP